jgi:hypothetical protein
LSTDRQLASSEARSVSSETVAGGSAGTTGGGGGGGGGGSEGAVCTCKAEWNGAQARARNPKNIWKIPFVAQFAIKPIDPNGN